MKINTKSAAIIAALAMATTGALALNQTEASASTVATVHAGTIARLYTSTGDLVQNRALAASTPWLVGKIVNIGGETMYQVSTNEYLRAADSSLSGDKAPQTTTDSNKVVIHIIDRTEQLYRDDTKSLSNRGLAAGSSWQVGKTITNKNGETFYQVSTHEYIKKSMNSILSHDTGEGQIINDFMIKNGDSSTNTNTDNNNSSTTTPDTNTNNSGSTTTTPSDNNSGSTTTPSTGTDTNNGSSETGTTDIASIKSAFMNSINAERAAKGLSTLTNDPLVQKMADIRAGEVVQTHTHYRTNGTKWYTLMPELGITYTTGGENIAMEFPNMTAQEMADDTMSSFRQETFANNHYDNIMNPEITKMGVSVKYDSTYNAYQIVEDFVG